MMKAPVGAPIPLCFVQSLPGDSPLPLPLPLPPLGSPASDTQRAEADAGRPREALASLYLTLGEVTHYGDGAAWAAAMVAVARCYDRVGEDGMRKTEDARRIAREVG